MASYTCTCTHGYSKCPLPKINIAHSFGLCSAVAGRLELRVRFVGGYPPLLDCFLLGIIMV